MSNTSCIVMLTSQKFFIANSALNFLWEQLSESFTFMIILVYNGSVCNINFVPILLVKSSIFLEFLCSHCNNGYLYQHWLYYCCFWRLADVFVFKFSTVFVLHFVIKNNNELCKYNCLLFDLRHDLSLRSFYSCLSATLSIKIFHNGNFQFCHNSKRCSFWIRLWFHVKMWESCLSQYFTAMGTSSSTEFVKIYPTN